MRAYSVLLIAFWHLQTPALADFAMLPPEDSGTPPTPAAPAPPTEAAKPPSTGPAKQKPATATRRGTPLAVGYGEKVPLSFAVRQIVPSRVSVAYDDGVAADALVNWQGGREWPAVLRDAVRPLGLRVTVRGDTVSISKMSASDSRTASPR